MDAVEIGTAIGLSGMIAAGVALVKGLYPGEMSPRAVAATVAIVAAVLLGAGVYGGEFTGTPLQLIGQWLMQAAAAIGFRESLVAASGGRDDEGKAKGPLSNLPTRQGTGS